MPLAFYLYIVKRVNTWYHTNAHEARINQWQASVFFLLITRLFPSEGEENDSQRIFLHDPVIRRIVRAEKKKFSPAPK